ncbi:unnamed protein product [Rotaria sp. Silwood2]|nr:unnamed protein product [Rotaria sp. Silwood2]
MGKTAPSIKAAAGKTSPSDRTPITTGELNDPFQVQKKNIRTAALIVCTFTYLIIGACVFDALEDAPFTDRKNRFERRFAQFKLDHNMTNETFRQLSDLIMNKTIVRHKWKFYDSFYFSTVVLALIGYGHRQLITSRGKIFCIFYAMLGIPMWLITFQSTGERLNSLLSYVLARLKHSLNMRQTKITDGELLITESLLSIVILVIGAFVFSKYEQWSFFDSFYYGFITLTTIGFGDYVVLQNNHRDKDFIYHAEYFFFCMAFIFLGLTVLASSMNLLVIRIVAFYSQERLLERLRQEEAANQAVLLKGDVICSTNTGKQRSTTPVMAEMTASQQQQLLLNSSQTSVCSCTCMETFSEWRQARKKRARWKKQQRYGLNKSIKVSESTSSLNMMYTIRRSSLSQRLEEQHTKHIQIEQEINELHRRKLSDLEEKHEQILSHERLEHENHVQILLNKLDQMKNEVEHIQSTTNAERQDLAKKLQDVFETTLFKGSKKINFPQNEPPNSSSSIQFNQPKLPLSDTQVKIKNSEYLPPLSLTNNDHPTSMSTIRTLSSRIDSLVDQTNRAANAYEFNSHVPLSTQQENTLQKFDNNQNHLLSSQPHSTLQSPFYRSTPIDSLQEWYPQTMTQSSLHTNNNNNNNQLTNRSHSADPISNSGLFSIYPSTTYEQQQKSSNSFSLDSNLNMNHIYQPVVSSYRSTSSITTNLFDHQQEVQETLSKDSIENQHNDQTSSTNESLARYVKMLLERSPTQDNNTLNKHPLTKTNRSLHDIQLSIEQLNLAERDEKVIVDDLVLHDESHSSHVITPRQHKSSTTTHGGGVKKRLDYDIHNTKQSNTNELFERLSQPKTRVKKDKAKQQQQQQQQQPSTGGHGAWK